MSPEIINDVIASLGQSVLRTIIRNIKISTPDWFAIISDEATDVKKREERRTAKS